MATRPEELVTPPEEQITAFLEDLQEIARQRFTGKIVSRQEVSDPFSADSDIGVWEFIHEVRDEVFGGQPQAQPVDIIAGGQRRKVSYTEERVSHPSSLREIQCVRRLTSEISGQGSVTLEFVDDFETPHAIIATPYNGPTIEFVMQPNGLGVLLGQPAPIQFVSDGRILRPHQSTPSQA